jgi:hypothetical protein
VELTVDEDNLATRLIAAMNIESNSRVGDGLDIRSDESLCVLSIADQEICTMSSKDRGPVITKEILAKCWGIWPRHGTPHHDGNHSERNKMCSTPCRATLQNASITSAFPTLNTRFYTDTMFSTTKSLRGNKCAQVFTNGLGYNLFYPLKKELEVADTLNKVI